MNSKILLSLASVAVLAGSSITLAAAQGHGRFGARGGDKATSGQSAKPDHARREFQRGMFGARDGGGREGAGHGLRARLEHRRAAIAKHIGQRLGITDAQREQFRAQAKTVAPAREEIRAEARAIIQRTRAAVQNGGDRAALREQARGELKALFQRAFPELQPAARAVVGQLTPEQRAKLEAGAARRGKTLDNDRLERGAALLLMRRARPEGRREQR